MTVQMTLTDDEAKVISDIRRVKAEKEQKIEWSLHLLDQAAEYALFLREEKLGDSYTTFCDEFGYGVTNKELPRSATHEIVMKLISLARCEAGLR